MIKACEVSGVGVITGAVDTKSLVECGISVFPKVTTKHGYMSYSPCEIGPYGVMDLFAAGIKVGQTMANCRLRGMDLESTAWYTIKNSPALDLTGEWSWIKH